MFKISHQTKKAFHMGRKDESHKLEKLRLMLTVPKFGLNSVFRMMSYCLFKMGRDEAINARRNV